MGKRSSKKSTATSWINQLDPDEINDAREEALVDAFGDYEQHSAFLTALEDVLVFPFSAMVLNEKVSVVAMKWPKDDEFGLDLVIERDSEKHRMDARFVELVEPFPDGHLTLAAYLKWRRFV